MIVTRLRQYLVYKGISVSYAEKTIGMSNGTLSKPFNAGTHIKTDTLEKFLNNYEDINHDWLLTGKGKMIIDNNFKNDSQTVVNEEESQYLSQSDLKGIPMIPIQAIAGWGIGDNQVMGYDAKRYLIPEFKEAEADFMITVRGESMTPNYRSGDVIACKKISDQNFYQWNKVYVLDTDQGAMIKRVDESDDIDFIKCVSDNKDYKPFNLNKKEINSIAIVLGLIRLE